MTGRVSDIRKAAIPAKTEKAKHVPTGKEKRPTGFSQRWFCSEGLFRAETGIQDWPCAGQHTCTRCRLQCHSLVHNMVIGASNVLAERRSRGHAHPCCNCCKCRWRRPSQNQLLTPRIGMTGTEKPEECRLLPDPWTNDTVSWRMTTYCHASL